MDCKRTNDKIAINIANMENTNWLAPFPLYSTEIIEDLKERNMITQKNDYNNVPVTYCKTCLSLKIRHITNPSVDYCIPCGNVDLGEIHISEWDELYKEKYGENYIDY